MNQYHIYEKIGKGKYSTVYKGRRKKTISYHAIKSVDKSQKARVLQEVRTMHALKHKNILRFFAWYETTNHLWLILEYCVGGDLMSLLRQDVRLPESSVHDFGRDLVVALQYLHHNSIIYCDLKPSNILLDENGRLKLGGFGMSRRLADINKTPLQALPAAKRGTPCYMAPELFSEGATHSSASDLWALGCVLYESAMGRPPFLNSSFNQLVQEILHNEPAPIPGASSEFADLIARLLDKNPATRIGWKDLVAHPFWQVKLSWLDMPHEPQLELFIKHNNLAPATADARASQASICAARTLRASVDVTRLSRIALSNLEKEGDGSDYAAVEGPGDIRIENADAELDFDEQREDGVADDEESPSPAQSDDGAVLDQSAPASDAARVGPIGMMASADMKQGQGRARGMEASGTRPSTAATDVAAAPVNAGNAHAGYDDAGSMNRNDGGTDGGAPPAVQTLIWHTSDNAVKPIVANRRIERLPDPKFDGKALPFTQLSLQDMLSAEQKELEHFLTDIYRAIASAAPLKDKVNVLSYFETLCVDTCAANVLINSSLTILFIRMLRNARAPTLRMRLASVLGLLVRHATYISDELSQTGVVEILTESLKDKNERVRRRVMATMGELLFYISTQQDAHKGITATSLCEHWSITPATINAVNRLLKPQEDEVTQHYAVKTIENICSQGADWASRLCSIEVATHLVQILNTTKNENLKATAASTISRILHYNPAVLTYVVDKFGIRLFVGGLSDPSSKVQTASVNMLNMALCHQDLKVRAKSALGEERSLVPSLMAMLDHAMPILRAKAVLAILLLSRMSTRWLVELCQAKLIPAVERLQREQEPYLQESITALRNEIAQLVASIQAQASEELRPGSRRAGVAASPSKTAATNRTPLQSFQVVLYLVTSPYFRATAVTPSLITDLATFVTAAANPAATNPGLPEFKTTLQHVLEALCQQTELLLQHHQAMLDHLLPALCGVVGTTTESHDMRFFSLRMITEVTQLFLLDPELYGCPTADATDQRIGVATDAVDKLMTQHVLPMVPQLLSEDDPMPLYALKLVGGLLEVNPAFVRSIEEIGLATQFFSFLSLEHSNNNVHNIRLCRQIVAAGSMPVSDMANMQVAERVSAVLDYATQNNVEPFLEPVLDLCHTIVMRDAKETEAGRSEGVMMGALLEHSGLFLELCASAEPHVSCAASLCLLDMVSVFPLQCAPWLLSSESMAVVMGVLQGEHTQGAPVPMQLYLNLLDAVCRSLQVPVPPAEPGEEQVHLLDPPDRQQLTSIAKQLSASPDALVRSKAAEVHTLVAALVAA